MLLLVLFLTCLCYLLPGVLLHVWLREREIALPICLGLGVAGLIVMDVWIASLVGYRFPLQLAANVAVIAGLVWRQWRQLPAWLAWARSQWPTPALWWGAVTAVFAAPAFVVTVPYDTDAAGFGLLALTMRLSGSINTMAPFWPDIKYFYSQGFFLLAAQLADIAGGATMPVVVLGLGHALAVATAAGIYAVGREFGGERVGAWTAVFAVIGYALFSTTMDSGYTNVLGNFLTTATLVLVFRAAREPGPLNVALAAVALASLPLSHPDSIIHLLMAYAPFYLTIWLARERPTRRQYLTLTAVVPGLAIALCLPWIARAIPLLGGIDVHERQNPALTHLWALFDYNGRLAVVLAAAGLAVAARRRRWFDVWLITWAAMIVEISSLGNFDALSRRTAIDPMQIFYPFGVAWHATIIPVPVLAAMAVCAAPPVGRWTPPRNWLAALSALAIVLAGAAVVFSDPLLRASKGRVSIVGAMASEADKQALYWLRDNTPRDAFILNYVGIEGDWVPVIAERKTVQFREQLFYVGAQPHWDLQSRLFGAYLDPASPDSEAAIRGAGVDYVFVPQVIGRPDSFADMQRWRPPFVEPLKSSFAGASYLELVRDFDGAQIWKVEP